MDRNKLITHILNNISELQSLTKGMESMADVPEFLHSLALEKVDNLKSAFLDLSVAKGVVEPEPIKVAELAAKIESKVVKAEESVQSEDEHLEEWQNAVAELKEEAEEDEVEAAAEKTLVREVAVEAKCEESTKIAEKAVDECCQKPSSSSTKNEMFKANVRSFGTTKSGADRRFVKDLKKALSLNDKFRYRKELFGGDNDKMLQTIDKLDACTSLNEALDYVSQFGWDDENEAVCDFISLLERRFAN